MVGSNQESSYVVNNCKNAHIVVLNFRIKVDKICKKLQQIFNFSLSDNIDHSLEKEILLQMLPSTWFMVIICLFGTKLKIQVQKEPKIQPT